MKTKTISFILGVATALHCAGADEFSIKPFLQLNSDSSMTVMWGTETNSFGWLEYGASTTLNHTAYHTIDGLRTANTKRHRIVLNDLTPGESLNYRTVSQPITTFKLYNVKYAEPVSSPVYSCKMLPGTDKPVRMVIYNDLHSRQATVETLSALTKDFDFDLSVFNGDCIADPQDEKGFIRVLRFINAGAKASERPVIYNRGNHETRGAYARNIRDWLAPLNGQFYGAFTAGPVRFILLDAGEDKVDTHPGYFNLNDFEGYRKAQAEFLKKELQTPEFKQAKYHVLIHHIPLYDTSTSVAASSRELWEPVLKDAPISLALSGHTHASAFYKTGEVGNPYPVMIGGGHGTEDATLILLEADTKRLKVRMLNMAGKEINSLTIPAPAQGR